MPGRAIEAAGRIQARPLTEEVAAVLLARIEGGEFGPGQRLPTADALARSFGVSRTVVREAMSRLKADGLVETRQGLGAFVAPDLLARPFRIDPGNPATPAALLSLFELRMGVETEAASLAARHRAGPQLAGIRAAMAAMDAAIARGDDAVEEDLGFHRAIAAATSNPLYTLFITFLGRHYRASILSSREGLGPALRPKLMHIVAEHRAIYEAIARAEPDAARAAMRTHLEDGRRRMLASGRPV